MSEERPFTLRPAGPEDARACFGTFRASLHDLLRRAGHSTRPGDDADERWPHYEAIFGHLGATAAEWWLAEDGAGAVLGYARSTLRAGTVELTEFFVTPEARVSGLGRALLERAFGPGLGVRRSVIATTDPPAVALYLRFGVRPQAIGAGFAGRPGPAEPRPGLSIDAADLDTLAALEEQVLGHARPQDLAFIASQRPAVVARRGGRAIGYAFLNDAVGRVGPVAALDPRDVPDLLAVVERAAHEAGVEELEFDVPFHAEPAVRWLLDERRFRIDPFYILLMADSPWAKLDRYLPFTPCLIL